VEQQGRCLLEELEAPPAQHLELVQLAEMDLELEAVAPEVA
jgi:hypothetical protein